MRLFIAIPLPESIVVTLEQLQGNLRHALTPLKPDIAWVPRENLHVTLRFLGDSTPTQAHSLQQLLETLETPSFHISLGALGAFPPGGPLRSLWIGLTTGEALVQALASTIEGLARQAGYPDPGRPFVSHITLGRVRHLKESAGARAKLLTTETPAAGFHVEAIELIESKLRPQGPEYVTLLRKSLTLKA